MPISRLRLQFAMVLATIALFLLMLAINEWLFKHAEFSHICGCILSLRTSLFGFLLRLHTRSTFTCRYLYPC